MSRNPTKEDLTRRIRELEQENLDLRNALEEREAKHRRILDIIDEGYYELDLKGNITSFNQSACSLLGYEPHEMPGMNYRDYTSPDTARHMYEVFHRIYETGNAERLVDYEILHRDGSVRNHEMSAGLRRDKSGRPIGFHVLVHDVTSRKQAEALMKKSEERYRSILESMEEAYYEVDLEGNFTFFNSRAVNRLGYTIEELSGMNYRQYMDEENARKVFDAYHQVFLTGKPVTGFAWELKSKQAQPIFVEASISLRRNAEGVPVGFFGVVRDITERKKAEEALRASEEKYRSILESMQEAYFEVDLKGNFTFFNNAAVLISGYSKEELMGMNYRQYSPPETAKLLFEAFHRVYQTGNPELIVDYEVIHKDGTLRDNEMSVWPMQDVSGAIVGFHSLVRDVTERKQSGKAIRQSEERYRTIFENTGSSSLLIGNDTTILLANSNFEKLTGYSKEEMEGKMSWTEFVDEADLERMKSCHENRRIDPSSVPQSYEFRLRNRSGETRDIYITVAMIPGTMESVASCIDITERKKAEEALRQSEERFRDLARLLPETVFETDSAGNITFVNEISLERFGFTREDVEHGISILDVLAPQDHERAIRNSARVMAGERLGLSEYTAQRKDGTTFPALVHSTSIYREGRQAGIRGFLIDVTEKKSLEEQLMRSQKLEAIGTLAGGIAHDFNNLLMGILGNISLMLMNFDESHPFHDRLKSMEEYVQRGSDLTKQLLGFARGGKYEVKSTDLGEFVRRSAEMFGRTKKEIRMHHKAPGDLWAVEVDRGQMEQVMLNLFVNAWQAMPGGGDLYLSVENVELDAEEVSPYGIKPGRFVKLTVTDTGVGMDAATKARVFEPFFSTKERGRGTGLGLASVYGIIKNHGGFILVDSEKDIGTSFTVYLPASDKCIEQERRAPDQVHKGSETVLIIDDEEMIVEVGKSMLESLGYRVITARGGRQGLQIFDRNKGTIDLVILDMVMPDLGGKETFEALHRQDPQVKVLLSSGYSLDGQAKEILAGGCRGFIQKPFTMAELSRRIRDILDGK